MPKQNKLSSKKPRLILASASPRRRFLMKEHGYRFLVRPSHISEKVPGRPAPSALVKLLALKKARFVARHYPGSVILGADTVVYIRRSVIGKPKHKEDAEKILRTLSGAWQKVYSGVAVVWNGGRNAMVRHAVSKVKFRKLTGGDILRAAAKHLDKAGAYSVQEKEDPFVERIEGDFDNVVGLPMRVVKELLSRRGVQRLLKSV